LKRKEARGFGMDAEKVAELRSLMIMHRESEVEFELIDPKRKALEEEVKEARGSWMKTWSEIGTLIDSASTDPSSGKFALVGTGRNSSGKHQTTEDTPRTSRPAEQGPTWRGARHQHLINPGLRESVVSDVEAKKSAYT
jgi:hypothetical protein